MSPTATKEFTMSKEALLQGGVFVVSASILYALAGYDDTIIAKLAPPFQFLLIASAGFFFHWLRGKFRIAYGSIELYVALFAIGSFTLNVHNLASTQDEYIAELIGSVYLMVRGLENITNYQGRDPLLRLIADRLKVRAYNAP
jgi:hypothetical protein